MLTTHEIEDILERFRALLHEANEDLEQPQIIALAEQLLDRGSSNGVVSSAEPVGLLQIAESFTALRQEIKLQTKGLRGLQDHIGTNQQALERAIDDFHDNRKDTLKAAEESATGAARPLIMCLLDIDEAIGQAVKNADAAREHSRRAKQSVMDELEREFHQLSSWKRVWLNGYQQRIRRRFEEGLESAESSNQSDIVEGLRLLQAGVRRTLSDTEVEVTRSIGLRVEPRTMCVVDVIDDPNHPPETVVEEIRAGYQWKGITLRTAEVRATKSKVTGDCLE